MTLTLRKSNFQQVASCVKSKDVKTQSFTVILFFVILIFFSPKPCKPEVQKLLRTFAMICRKIIAFKFVETPEAGAFIQTRPKPKLNRSGSLKAPVLGF